MKTLGAALICWAVVTTSAVAGCQENRVELRGEWGAAQFTVEVADTAMERSVGLMNRPSMSASAGMIFIYEQPQRVGFWMRNTLIPLDMLFLSEDGVVQKIHENAIPLDETLIPGGDDIQYVLEINGGMAKTLGITVGSELRHPGINQIVASWPCKAH